MTYVETKTKIFSSSYRFWLTKYIEENIIAKSNDLTQDDESNVFLNILPYFHAWLQENGSVSYSDLFIENNMSCTTNFFYMYGNYYRISSAFGASGFCICEKLKFLPKGRSVYFLTDEFDQAKFDAENA